MSVHFYATNLSASEWRLLQVFAMIVVKCFPRFSLYLRALHTSHFTKENNILKFVLDITCGARLEFTEKIEQKSEPHFIPINADEEKFMRSKIKSIH